ncbi:MAG: class I SAM-dependent methyltransferase [Candidatus Woesearchaeota archaeon]
MKKIFYLLNNVDLFIQRRKELFRNYIFYKFGSLPKFEYSLTKDFLKSKQNFQRNLQLYQSHPDLNLKAQRPSICRFKVYNLEKYINKQTTILDVGGNIGFFSFYVSSFVKSIDVVEYNNVLIKISTKVKKHLNIKNVTLINKDIKKYASKKKYDVIFSFAIHKWVGESLDNYLKRLFSLLKKGGIILFESHIGDKQELLNYLKNNKNIIIIKQGITDDHDAELRYFFYIKNKGF